MSNGAPPGSQDNSTKLNADDGVVSSLSEPIDDPCYICLFELDSPCYADGCLHKFCSQCLLQWSKQSNHCPVCRTIFRNLIVNVTSDTSFEEIPIQAPGIGLFDMPPWETLIEVITNNLQNVALSLTSDSISSYLDPRNVVNMLSNSGLGTRVLQEIENFETVASEGPTNGSIRESNTGWIFVRNRRNRRRRQTSQALPSSQVSKHVEISEVTTVEDDNQPNVESEINRTNQKEEEKEKTSEQNEI